MAVKVCFGRRFWWQMAGNRLSKQGDTATVMLVAIARPAGFWHVGLRHFHGRPFREYVFNANRGIIPCDKHWKSSI
jgi:hypothetical protein